MPRRRTSTRRSNRRSTRRSTRRTNRSTRRTNRSLRRSRNNRQRGGAGNPSENPLDNLHLLPDYEPAPERRQTLLEALENTRALPVAQPSAFAQPSAVAQTGLTLFDALNINPTNFKPKPPSQMNPYEKLMHGYDDLEGALDRQYAPKITPQMPRTLSPPPYEDVYGPSERDIKLSAHRGEIPYAPAPPDPVEQRAMEAELEPLKKIFDVRQASAASEPPKNPYSPFRSKAERDKILAEELRLHRRALRDEPALERARKKWEREQQLIALNKNRSSKSIKRRRGRGKGTALALKDQKIHEEMLRQLEQSRMAQSSARSERSQRRSGMEGGMEPIRPPMEIAGEYLNKQSSSSSSNSYQGINEGDYVNLPKEEQLKQEVPLESFSSPREVEAPLGEPGQFQHRDDFVEMEELDQMVGKMYGRSKKARSKKARSKKAKGPSVAGPKKGIKKPTAAEARANRARAMKRLKEKREKQASNTNKSSTKYKSRKDIADKRPRVKGRFSSTGDNVITSKK